MLKKIIHTFGINAFSAALNMAVAVLLSQFLGPSGKGSQSLILTTISFILIFSNLVGGATIVYLIPRYKTFLLIVPSYLWTLLMSLVSFFILKLTGLIESKYIIHVCILAIIYSVTSIHSNILVGKQRIRESNNLILLQSVLLVISLLVSFIVFRIFSINAYISALYISMGSSMLISAVLLSTSFKEMKLNNFTQYFPVVKQMLTFGFQNQVAHITQLLSFRLSFYVIEEYAGIAAVGIYSNGISIAESIWMVAKSMSLVQYSYISNSTNREESARITMLLVKAGLAASLLLLIPLVLIPVEAYVFIFGQGFSDIKPVIITLLPGIVIYNVSILFGHYFSGTGRYSINGRISAIGLVVSVILYFTLIPLFSIRGAGIATSLSYIFTSLLFLWYFAKENKDWHTYLTPRWSDIKLVITELKKAKNIN
jgi:O-antigen/teichoic acid export membrane protein